MYDIHRIARSEIPERFASGLHQMPMPEICVHRYAEARWCEIADAHSGKASRSVPGSLTAATSLFAIVVRK
jgi:hypothetical protein